MMKRVQEQSVRKCFAWRIDGVFCRNTGIVWCIYRIAEYHFLYRRDPDRCDCGHDSAESGTWVFKRLFLGRGGEHDGCTDEESLSCVCDALCFVLCVDLVSIQILSQTVFFKSEILGGARILWEFILYYGAVRIMYWLCMWSYPGGEKEVGLCVISDKYFSLRDRNFPGGREIHGLS